MSSFFSLARTSGGSSTAGGCESFSLEAGLVSEAAGLPLPFSAVASGIFSFSFSSFSGAAADLAASAPASPSVTDTAGVGSSSSSSRAKEASKDAGSGVWTVSAAASFDVSTLGLLGRGRRVGSRSEADLLKPSGPGALPCVVCAFCRACSSAMVRSIAPRIRYRDEATVSPPFGRLVVKRRHSVMGVHYREHCACVRASALPRGQGGFQSRPRGPNAEFHSAMAPAWF